MCLDGVKTTFYITDEKTFHIVIFMCFVFVVLLECNTNNKQKFLGVKQEVSALLIQAERWFHAESHPALGAHRLVTSEMMNTA